MKLTRQSIVRSLKNPASFWQTVSLVGLASAAYAFRSHPYILKPQLYAEDGTIWLAKGRAEGYKELFVSDNGFYHVAERFFGVVVAHLPLQWAPMVFALTAWGLFILTIYYLLSPRTKILLHNYERIFVVLSLCLIANFNEFFFNFSNSIFLLGIIGALILIAKQSKYRIVAVAEKILFVFASLTLPFTWFYVPIALFDRCKYKAKNTYFLAVSVVTSIIQATCYITSHVNRSPVTLWSLFSKYILLELYNQIIIPAVRFARIDISVSQFGVSRSLVLLVCVSVTAVLVATITVLKRSNKQVWFLLFFLACMTFASLKSPTITVKLPEDAIKIMATVTDGNRYFVYGIIGVTIIFAKAVYQAIAPKARYIFMVFFITFGLASSLGHGAFFVHKNWKDYTTEYRKGINLFYTHTKQQVIIPENPEPWSFGLSE